MSRAVRYPTFFELGFKTHYLLRRAKKDPTVCLELYRICKRFAPDIIHTWDSMTSMYALPVAKLLGIKLVNGMITDAFDLTPFDRLWVRSKLTFPFSDIVIGNSYAGLSSYRAPEKKSTCVYNGFDSQRAQNLTDPTTVRESIGISTQKVVGMVGQFSDRKDYDTYAKAAQIVLATRDDVIFLSVGDGENLERYKQSVADQFRDRILFLGWRSDVESIINVMDVGVLSSFREGISNSILEYMALGKPVVATEVGGTPEIVVDGATGYLVPLGNPEALAQKISDLLNDPAKGRIMGEQGRARVSDVFSIENMGRRYTQIYGKLLRGEPRT
jgi:glycosyltransferase involved in cell wall biosynthesis